MLESLLRVQDFENFEKLVPLLNMTPLAERERRELLAQMYLRRGFLRSAGREWMAVCEQQPDVRALVGLAHVALANGQTETANTFAENALALDPGNESRAQARGRRAGSRCPHESHVAATRQFVQTLKFMRATTIKLQRRRGPGDRRGCRGTAQGVRLPMSFDVSGIGHTAHPQPTLGLGSAHLRSPRGRPALLESRIRRVARWRRSRRTTS